MCLFIAMVSKLDESVGRVVQALKEKDMLENTIIVFMSDNGSPTFDDSGRELPSHVDVGISPNWGSNFPFRGVSVICNILYCTIICVENNDYVYYRFADKKHVMARRRQERVFYLVVEFTTKSSGFQTANAHHRLVTDVIFGCRYVVYNYHNVYGFLLQFLD